jgi:hypothetical protein
MSGREQSRLRRARENGYLDACCTGNEALVQAYGLWCWRLKIPMVWLERRTRCSRYRRVQLEMYTSTNRLTPAGQDYMKGICVPANTSAWTRISAHDARWDHVARPSARELAGTVFRAAVRLENQCRNETQVENRQEWKTGKILQMA